MTVIKDLTLKRSLVSISNTEVIIHQVRSYNSAQYMRILKAMNDKEVYNSFTLEKKGVSRRTFGRLAPILIHLQLIKVIEKKPNSHFAKHYKVTTNGRRLLAGKITAMERLGSEDI